MSDAAGEAYARIDEWVSSAKKRAEQARAVQAELSVHQTQAESRDGLVRVVVDAQGTPTVLDIDDRAMGGRGEDLAATLLATMREAQARMPADVAAIATSHFGEGSPDADALTSAYRARFGTTDERVR